MPTETLKQLAGRLASYEAFIVLLLTLAAVARPQWGVVALGLVAALWLIRWAAAGRLSVRTALDWAVGGLILALPAALWMSADLSSSLGDAARLLLGVSLLYAVANSATHGWRLRATVGMIVVGGAGLAVLGLMGATRPAGQLFNLPQGLFAVDLPVQIHANVLATALVMVFPLAAALALWGTPEGWPRGSRAIAIVAALVILVTLVLVQSRGAFLGLLAAVAGMTALRWPRTRWPLFGLAIAFVVVLIVVDVPLVALLVAGIPGREEVWLRALTAIGDFPLTGIGIGLFDRVVPILYPYFMLGAGPAAQASHAHNLFLQVAVDLGLPGLIGFGAVILSAAATLAWSWRHGLAADRPLAWGLAGSLIALAVHGLVDAVAWSSKASPLLWLLLGLVVILPQRSLSKVKSS